MLYRCYYEPDNKVTMETQTISPLRQREDNRDTTQSRVTPTGPGTIPADTPVLDIILEAYQRPGTS